MGQDDKLAALAEAALGAQQEPSAAPTTPAPKEGSGSTGAPTAGGVPRWTVCVQDQSGEVVEIKCKPSTRLHKIMVAYADQKRIDPGAFRWVFDGQRVSANATLEQIGFADGDYLHTMVEQVRGGIYGLHAPIWQSAGLGEPLHGAC